MYSLVLNTEQNHLVFETESGGSAIAKQADEVLNRIQMRAVVYPFVFVLGVIWKEREREKSRQRIEADGELFKEETS